MSNVDINKLIPINAGTVNTGFTQATLAGLLLTKNPLIPFNRTQKVLSFPDAPTVGDYFGLTSQEYLKSVNYFDNYTGSINRPPFLLFGKYVDASLAPFIRGGATTSANLTALQAITSGSLTLEFDGLNLVSTGTPPATGVLPVASVSWTRGTDNFVTVLNKTAETISTFKWIAGELVQQGVAVATGNVPLDLTHFTIGVNDYVSVVNSTDNTVETYLWSGTVFASIGAAVSTGVGTTPSGITSFVSGVNTYLTITNAGNDTFSTFLWNGSTFAISGAPVSTGTLPTRIRSYLVGTDIYIALINATAQTVSVYSWNGVLFSPVQVIALAGTLVDVAIYAIGGLTYLTISDATSDLIETYVWSGVLFSSIGAGVATGTGANGLAFFTYNSVNYLVVANNTANSLFVYAWNGTTWAQVGAVATGTDPVSPIVSVLSGIVYISELNSGADTIGTFDWIQTGIVLTGLDFSSTASFSQVAAIVQAAMISAGFVSSTVTWDSTTSAFTVSNGDVSGTGTVDYSPVGSVATAMLLTQAGGAILSQGSLALTPAQNMSGLRAVTRNWFSFSQLFDLSNDYPTVAGLSAWAASQRNRLVYVPWSTEATLAIPGSTSNVSYALVADGQGSVVNNQVTFTSPIFPQYSEANLAAMLMGTGASVNYNNPNSVLSFAYKAQDGIIPLVTTDEEYTAVLQNGFNLYGAFDSAANVYDLTQNGALGGIFKWADFAWNQGWLDNTLQDTVATFFKAALQVPNDALGYAQLRAIIDEVAQKGLKNGVITAGNEFDDATKATLKQQAGYAIDGFLTTTGYYLQIIPVTPSQRVNRQPPTTTLWYSSAGSIITLPITTELVF